MKDEVVARLRELRAKATPGPWTPSVEPHTYANGKHWYVVLDDEENGIGEFYGDDHEANSANVRLAAEAPAMADLIEQQALLIEELREGLEKVRGQLVATLAGTFNVAPVATTTMCGRLDESGELLASVKAMAASIHSIKPDANPLLQSRRG